MNTLFFKRISAVLAIELLCSLLLLSCSARNQVFQQLSPLPAAGVCRVAVLFPNNKTDYNEGEVLIFRVLQSHLNQQPNLFVSQEGDVRRQYRDLRLQLGSVPTYEELRVMGDRLGVQGLILTEITRMHETNKDGNYFPALTITVRLVDAESGTTIWQSHVSSEGDEYRKVMHFGLVNTMTKLTGIISEKIIDTWQENGFGKCGN